MSHIEKNIEVNARAEKVFSILNDPNVWQYKMAGRKALGPISVKESQKPKHLVVEAVGTVPSHWEWMLNPLDSITTDVSVALDYTPGSFLGALADKLVRERQNEKLVEHQLAKLKRMAERS